MSEFSEEEIKTLRKGAMGAGLLVSVSDRGFMDTFKEAGALSKHVTAARESSDSAVLREIAKGHGTGFSATTPTDELEAGTLAALRESVSLLQAKAPQELEAYRSFVLEIARSVAAAATGGDQAETAAISKIEQALQEPAPPA